MHPSIGVITTSTNSLSRNYFAFYACIDSWIKIADELIIVDGESSDNSYDFLKGWVNKNNYKVLSDNLTLWGNNGKWHPAQWTINTTFGLKNIETDWVFIINSDYVLLDKNRDKIIKLLEGVKDSSMVVFPRFSITNEGRLLKRKLPGFVLNMKKLREEGYKPGFGVVKSSRGLSDRPINIFEYSDFIDPANYCKKTYYAGEEIPICNEINLKVAVYGHFFFNAIELLKKIHEFYNVFQVRYSAHIPYPSELIAKLQNINLNSKILPKDKLLNLSHPDEMKKVIDYFYRDDMVGYISDRNYLNKSDYILKQYYRIKYKSNFLFRGFKSVNKEQQWYNTDCHALDPLIIRELYNKQNESLPDYYQIKF
jgi:hypothetical protein